MFNVASQNRECVLLYTIFQSIGQIYKEGNQHKNKAIRLDLTLTLNLSNTKLSVFLVPEPKLTGTSVGTSGRSLTDT